MALGPRSGPPGAQGFPGPRGQGQKGDTGDAIDPGVSVTDNLDGSFTLSVNNPFYNNTVTWYNGAKGDSGQDGFDGNGNFISFVYAQVPAGDSAPGITQGTGSFNGTTETFPSGTTTWNDDPVFSTTTDTYVSRRTYSYDKLTDSWSGSLWTDPVIFNQNQTNIQNKFVSYVFTRTADSNTIPTGGSYSNPLPTAPAGWSDGIPAGTAPVYFSKRLFTSDGQSPQDGAWTSPELMLQDGDGFKFQFAPTNTGPWDDVPATDDEWMVKCTLAAGGSWVCDYANPVKIKGETGASGNSLFRAYAFKRSINPLSERPTGGTFLQPYPVDGVVTGWTDSIPGGDGDLYMSTRLFTADGLAPQENEWSLSSLFSGDGAIQFRILQDAYFFKFDKDGLNPYPANITFTAFAQNIGFTPDWEVYEDDGVTTITTAATKLDTDTFSVTSSEFGSNNYIIVRATAGLYSDEVKVLRIQDGLQGPAGTQTEIREVRFQYADFNGGVLPGPSSGLWGAIQATSYWIREGTFYDGVLQGSWSTGTQFVGDDGALTYTEFWFSPDGVDTPDDNPPGGTQLGDWSQTQRAGDFYVISKNITNGSVVTNPTTGTDWSPVSYIRGDDGVDGKYFETRFAVAPLSSPPVIDVTSPTPPDYNDTVAIPPGWVIDPDLPTTGDEVIWAITATKLANGNLDTNWTVAVQWGAYNPRKGSDYTDGLGGTHVSNYFVASTAQPPAPSGGAYDATNGETGVTLTVDDPDDPGVATITYVDDPFSPPTGKYVWISRQVYTPSIQVNGENTWAAQGWSTPARYAYIPTFGTDYQNGATGLSGEGVYTSYIFRNETVGTTPGTPTGGTYQTTPTISETFPTGWADDPTSPADDTVLTWVSVRTYTKAEGTTTWVGGDWATPVLFSGTPTFTGYLSDIGGSINADFDGTGYDLTGYSGTFECEYGGTQLSSGVVFTVNGGAVNGIYHEVTQNGLTMRINQTTGAFTLVGASPSWTSTAESFTLTATYSNTSVAVSRRYRVYKTVNGIDGIDGNQSRLDFAYADDASGTNVAYPSGRLTNGVGQGSGPYTAATRGTRSWQGTNVVTWSGAPDTNEPEADPADNGLSTPDADDWTAYEWTRIEGEDGLSNRVDIAYAAVEPANNGQVSSFPTGTLDSNDAFPYVKATYTEGTDEWMGTNVVSWVAGTTEPNANTFNYNDYEWTKIQGEQGVPGTDAPPPISVLVYKPAVAVPTDPTGSSIDYDATGTNIAVYAGDTALAYVTTTPGNGQWTIGTVVDTGITVGAITDGGNVASVDVASAMTLDTATIQYPITGKHSTGEDFTVSGFQVFTKAPAGADGADGATGAQGPQGVPGTNGTNGADGVDGADGTSILFQGTFAGFPTTGLFDGYAFYNSNDGKSYVRQSGVWYQMTIDGANGANGADGNDGLSIDYRGEFASPPGSPQLNWAYKDTDNGIVYIYNGASWEVMINDGSDGADGTNGLPGSDGDPVFVTYNSNAIDNPPNTPTGDGTTNGWTTTASAASNWLSQKVAPDASSGTWGAPILIKGETGATGATGAASVSGVLSNESHGVPVDINGNNQIYTGASTEFYVYQGGTKLTNTGSTTTANEYAVGTSASAGVTYNFDAPTGDTLTITALTADIATVTLTATGRTAENDSFTVIKTFTVFKAYPGNDGADGNDGRAFSVTQTIAIFRCNADGTLKSGEPTSVTFDSDAAGMPNGETAAEGWALLLGSVNNTTGWSTAGSSITVNFTDMVSEAFTVEGRIYNGAETISSNSMTVTKVFDGTDGLSADEIVYSGNPTLNTGYVRHVSGGKPIGITWSGSATVLDTIQRSGQEVFTLHRRINNGAWTQIASLSVGIISIQDGSDWFNSISSGEQFTTDDPATAGNIDYQVREGATWIVSGGSSILTKEAG